MNPEEPLPAVRSSSISAEAMIGIGITIGAIGVLFLMLGWAQHMRQVYDAAWILLPIGAVLLVVGGLATLLAQLRKRR
ncbi:MAG: hypothetical protein M3Q89_14705 [Verrucomicrobiota bacterium]|nr:hypothetical protein [Verrucomicrobiota bacterium]